ncbi:DUF6362 family protein [Zavarzinia compransoris]|uniref:DUF6362 domain-containing protein n=1 Tax=Zavarzinia compransoris TaxID=1264899 RepID=A0A317EAM6_9PROT|nr:DUF6362 family protein [Zavarzinia compransoris]PWR24009.1 hypothetical protein DKG75_05560 [Zavarzinia compransoris]TDP48269.1 hypothetical protein DES42_102572 [Zavarzinia compransoris]
MWTGELVAARLEEAADTLRRLPDTETKYRLGLRSAWPDVVRESVAVQASTGVRVRLGPPSPGAIDRLEATIGWLSLLTEAQRRIAWALASGISAARLARMIGCHRNTIANRQAAALRIIAGHLNQPAAQGAGACVQDMGV